MYKLLAHELFLVVVLNTIIFNVTFSHHSGQVVLGVNTVFLFLVYYITKDAYQYIYFKLVTYAFVGLFLYEIR